MHEVMYYEECMKIKAHIYVLMPSVGIASNINAINAIKAIT